MKRITYQINEQLWSMEDAAKKAGYQKEEPAEAVQAIMDRLTVLKAESIAEADPFGQSPADREINAIAATLAAFGFGWCYRPDSAGKWIATAK